MAKLSNGATLTSLYNSTYEVEKFLDNGSQASVYLVSHAGKKCVLKWYSKTNERLILHFKGLIAKKAPKDKNNQPDKRFVWPTDIIVTDDGFGYTMDFIEMNKYTELHMLTHKLYIKNENCIKGTVLCDICINLAEAFNNLHSSGYCYKDISSNNIVFNIQTGEVLIFDVDNVVVAGEAGEIFGTPKYMAPEAILGTTHPDSQSDRFALASYFFHLLVGHYPLEGKLRDDYIKTNGVFDDNGFKNVYGTNAAFCFNPNSDRNNLSHNDYAKVVERWEYIIPLELKEKFYKTFVKGLSFDTRVERTTNKEWIALFREFKKNIITCSCGRNYLPGAIKCIVCSKPFAAKILVREKDKTAQKEVILKRDSIIKGEEISKIISGQTKLAEVISNPKNGEIGLKNLSALEWYYKDVQDADLQRVPPNSIVTLKSGRVIAFVRGEVQVTVK